MSVVVGSVKGFMLSDRRVSADGERCRPSDKVFGNEDLVAGAVGAWCTVRRLRRAIEKGARNPDELVDVVKACLK